MQERLKHYDKKVKKLESADYLAKNRRSLTLNIGAANRFIDNAVPSLTKEQKEALRQVRCIAMGVRPSEMRLSTIPMQHSFLVDYATFAVLLS